MSSTARHVARYIAIEGPPQVGKSALMQLLGERLSARTIADPGPNPFAAGQWSEPGRHGLPAQLYALLSRYQLKDALPQEDLFARGVVADHLLVCSRLGAQACLGRDELLLYDKLYQLFSPAMPRPDLVVYLQAPADQLLTRLKRSYPSVRHPSREVLENIIQGYADFFFNYGDAPLLVVNTEEIDWIEDRRLKDELVAIIHKTKAGITHYKPLGSLR